MGRRTRVGASVLLVHHPRKGGAGEGQAARGSGALPGYVDTIIELRRFTKDDQDDRRRVLTAYSRFDETPRELVIELKADGYATLGTKADTNQTDRLKAIRTILPANGKAMTADAILDAWPDDVTRPSKRTLRYDLERAVTDLEIHRTGTGIKGDPHRFLQILKRGTLHESNSEGQASRESEPQKPA